MCAGLDAAVQGYPFEAWGLSGPDLLGLEPGVLEALGVRPVGHQELLLEAVEQLRKLVSAGIPGRSRGTWGSPGLKDEDVGSPWAGGRWGHRDTLTQWRGALSWAEGRTWGHRGLGEGGTLNATLSPLSPQDTGLASTSLRTLTERLQELAQGIQSLVQGELWAGDAPQPPSLTLLARVIDLVGAAKELFSWLNRCGAGEGTPGCWVSPPRG